ncbi:MAG TPA: molecular chaperone HtpG [Blastocatellia bacterium]|nr:molecular chaperone HtpG [Blastocatellia bacterium]
MASMVEEFQFEAETRQLLDLMIHSLYTNKEIFLRELISNASDALDRLRFEALTNPELIAGDDRYEIRLEADQGARTLSISDTGIGMSRDEVIANIGTIAKSGTRELRERIKEGQSSQMLAESIGQFGVGFYSAFMVADKVSLVTRRAGETRATGWESSGDGTYKLTEGERPGRGTTVTLHLKPVDPETGIEDFTDQWTLSRVVKKHSDFVSYPIICRFESEQMDQGGSATAANAPPTITVEDKILNSMKPIWTRAQSGVTENEYNEFYRHISDDWSEPFKTIALKAEGTIEYQALLFIPSKAPYDLYYHGFESGLRLYAKRIMIVKRCEDLLPRYLRFVRGVVDSADLPLNISRQMLQQDRHITLIRKWLTKKVLDTLQELKDQEHEKYLQFWEQFGRSLKEGVSSDYDNKDKILGLLLFQSSNDPQNLTTLHDYVGRMKEGQNEIYYLTGESRSVIESSPHIEAFKEKGYEVLYLVDPVDELLVQSLMDYEGKKLKSVGKGVINLGSQEEKEKAAKELKQKEEEVAGLLELLQKAVDQQVKQVRLSSRLVSSPACLVGTDIDYSPQLERLLQKGKGGGPKQRRILELNPNHELFLKMQERYKRDNQDKALADCAELLLGYALLAEGSELEDPIRFNRLVINAMLQTL